MEYDSQYDPDYKREYTDAPIIGESDPWFRVTGVNDTDDNVCDTYIIENGKNINIDTMYGYGYQTVFINEDIDSFVPAFWKADDEAISIDRIYANGREFQEGSELSFPEGENTLDATFSVIITDKNGSHPKNYDVTFVKKASGPQLYVAGPLAPDVRSVFLDEYHENKHDIFIANIGDEPLTDLWLDLDATNVELDDYWTIGGEGNNTLEACPENFSLELDSTSYGELSNVAKIRLVPPASGKGEIEGTLKIYSGKEGDAENSELLATVILSDLAQNPEITTEEVEDAVKYVPYSYLITTDNMYDWVNVSYELTAGSLPDAGEQADPGHRLQRFCRQQLCRTVRVGGKSGHHVQRHRAYYAAPHLPKDRRDAHGRGHRGKQSVLHPHVFLGRHRHQRDQSFHLGFFPAGSRTKGLAGHAGGSQGENRGLLYNPLR